MPTLTFFCFSYFSTFSLAKNPEIRRFAFVLTKSSLTAGLATISSTSINLVISIVSFVSSSAPLVPELLHTLAKLSVLYVRDTFLSAGFDLPSSVYFPTRRL